MKTSQDPRHLNRITTVEELFAYSFYKKNKVSPQTQQIIDHLDPIDKTIAQAAPLWPIEKIAKIDLAILRLAVSELRYAHDTPPKVIIDEAVEIAKSYGNEKSSSFINGVLGTIIKSYKR